MGCVHGQLAVALVTVLCVVCGYLREDALCKGESRLRREARGSLCSMLRSGSPPHIVITFTILTSLSTIA